LEDVSGDEENREVLHVVFERKTKCRKVLGRALLTLEMGIQ
jgi:hypothetical protein